MSRGKRLWRSTPQHRRANRTVAVAAVLAGALLLGLGLQLHSSQRDARALIVERFEARAKSVAALTEALFSTASAPSSTQRYTGRTITDADLEAAKSDTTEYLALLDERGKVIAATSAVDDALRARLAADPNIEALRNGSTRLLLGDVDTSDPKHHVIPFSVGFPTKHGRRVIVNGGSPMVFSLLMGGYLRRSSSDRTPAYIIDSGRNVIGARDPDAPLGQPIDDRQLAAALDRSQHGSFGPNQYVSVPIQNSTWSVVWTAPKSTLFATITGSRKWLPWGIFVALAALAGAFLVVLRRQIIDRTALSLVNESLVTGKADLERSNARLESTNTLLRRAAELARSNAELEQFASIASHDLQEPLRKVQTFAAQLNASERENLSDEGQDYLRRMSDAAGRMRALIDDLLAFSRVSTKGRPFVPVNLRDVVGQVLNDLEIQIDESDAKVIVQDPLPTVAADPVQMGQLFQNLIGNALKFRRPDVPPEIQITATIEDDVAVITLRDNGIGFDEKYAQRIFRAFERLHGAGQYAGTGIGLALCRKIVERHHGAIAATSPGDEGATFTVTLPTQQDTGPDLPHDLFPAAEDHAEEAHATHA